MSITRDLLASTPFVSPSSSRFVKNATKSGLLGDIPVVGTAVKAIPFASFFDDRLKYPLLITGRLIFSIALTVAVSQFTLSQSWKNTIDERILPVVAATPVKEELKETGNFLNDNSEKLKIETGYLIDQAVNQIVRSSWKEGLSGTIALPIRFAGIYAFISILYMIFGNTIPQLERKYLKKSGNLAEFAKNALLMLDALATRLVLTKEEVYGLKNIVIATQKGEGISKHEELFLKNLSLNMSQQIHQNMSLNTVNLNSKI